MVADGEFSVLVANRFPPLGANTVYLISLEGWTESARLHLDHSSSRVASTTDHARQLDLRQRSERTRHIRRIDAATEKELDSFGIALPGTSGEDYVDKALKRGYVPLDYKPCRSTPTLRVVSRAFSAAAEKAAHANSF